MIDFASLVLERTVTVPIRGNQFLFERKKYSVSPNEDGWFVVALKNNDATVVNEAYDFTEVKKNKSALVKGYTYNNSIVFKNFDVAKRKWSFGLSKQLYFNRAQTFNPIVAVTWEDKNVYYIEDDYTDFKSLEIKTSFDNEESLEDKKGVTPELRSVYLFHSIERDSLREMAVAAQKAEEQRELMNSIPGRLQVTFGRAGAELLDYSITGRRIEVTWRLNDQKYNSIIDSETWMVLEAGYCMSNDDRRHNITSLVKLADDYGERGLTYITRR